MSVWTRLAGRFLDLPPPRCRVERSTEWVRVTDGTRLATTLYRPSEGEPRATVFARSVAPLRAPRQPAALMARLLAEQGHRVVVQECRGLQTSEGRFDPFLADGDDGADTLDWLAAQPGSGGPIVLVGLGYAGHAAWATLAAARQPVQGLLVGFAARDPYSWLYTGGAFELENGFELALALAAAEPEGVRTCDLARAVRHRPLCDADRVAARRIDWLRGWLEHPHADRYWEERTPPLPTSPPKTLLVAGAYHATLGGMLEDYAALADAAEAADVARPQLLVGPWAAGAQTRRERPKDARLARGGRVAAAGTGAGAVPRRERPIQRGRAPDGGAAGGRRAARQLRLRSGRCGPVRGRRQPVASRGDHASGDGGARRRAPLSGRAPTPGLRARRSRAGRDLRLERRAPDRLHGTSLADRRGRRVHVSV